MLNRIELIFKRLKAFNHKLKPPKSCFFQCTVVFLGHVLSAKGISANPQKVEKSPELGSTNKCQGATFLFSPGFVLPEVHTQICHSGKVFAPTHGTQKIKRSPSPPNVNSYLKPNKTSSSSGGSPKKLSTNSKRH